jgi:hypothetical protein
LVRARGFVIFWVGFYFFAPSDFAEGVDAFLLG